MADAQHLRCCAARHAGSSPAPGTNIKMESSENNNPTLDTLKKIAKALKVSVDELIK